MSKMEELCREAGVFNDHEFFNGVTPAGQVWLSYHPQQHRSPVGARWTVYRRGYKTDPGAAWYDYGNKSFSGFRPREGMTRRASALEDAKEWARKYGISEWKRTPFGGYGEAGFVKARLAELRAIAEARVGS